MIIRVLWENKIMPDVRNLPYLLNLLNDRSTAVQMAVLRELAAFGPSLEHELMRLENPPDPIETDYIIRLVHEYRKNLVNNKSGTY